MKKNFVKFFVTEMIPITEYEKKMHNGAKNTYKTFSTFCGLFSLTAFFLSRRSWKMGILRSGKHLPQSKRINVIIYNLAAVFGGVLFGNIYKYHLLYEHSLFMRERLLSELNNNIYRDEVMQRNNGVLFEDYPFAHMDGMITDAELRRIKVANAKQIKNKWIRSKDVMLSFVIKDKKDKSNTENDSSSNSGIIDDLSISDNDNSNKKEDKDN